jgi:hypothetical protein
VLCWVLISSILWIHWQPWPLKVIGVVWNPFAGAYAILRKKGECCVDTWMWLLYVNSPRDSSVFQSFCHFLMKIRIYCSSSWFTSLVWPVIGSERRNGDPEEAVEFMHEFGYELWSMVWQHQSQESMQLPYILEVESSRPQRGDHCVGGHEVTLFTHWVYDHHRSIKPMWIR